MGDTNFMHGWTALMGFFASIALIVTAMGLMLGVVTPANALKYGGSIVGIVIVCMLIAIVLTNLWSGMSVWQRIVLAAMGIGVWQWRRERRTRKGKEE